MRGFVIPPTTGSCTFWIASDDSAELRISTDATQANAVARASNSSATGQYVYNSFASQKSVVLTLTADQPCYIKARHKEGSGDDYLSGHLLRAACSRRRLAANRKIGFTPKQTPGKKSEGRKGERAFGSGWG